MRHVAVQMRAHGNRAMGVSRAQREFCTHAHIGLRPIHVAVSHDRGDGAKETTIRIGGALPDMALIQMGMRIQHTGPDLPAIQRNPIRRRAQRRDGGDASLFNLNIKSRNAISVQGQRPRSFQHRAQGAHIAQPEIAARAGQGRASLRHGAPHRRSPLPIALSCQWRSSKCVSKLSARKIAIPVAETSTRAANMRGICN